MNSVALGPQCFRAHMRHGDLAQSQLSFTPMQGLPSKLNFVCPGPKRVVNPFYRKKSLTSTAGKRKGSNQNSPVREERESNNSPAASVSVAQKC